VLEDTPRHVVRCDELSRPCGAARNAAQGLVERHIAPGDRIALVLPTSRDFFITFFAILYAGAVPVPIYPPGQLSLLEERLHHQARILRNAGARILITVPEGRRVAALLKTQVESVMVIETVNRLSPRDTVRSQLPLNRATSTALIQNTRQVARW
jgi:acyl-CoA synthetase (AMP-forming)/AMP-acid ligase II